MRLDKPSLALATLVAAVAGASASDGASAGYFFGGGYRGYIEVFDLYRAPQPSQTLTGATSRSSSRDTRRTPYMGSRGVRGDPRS
jgi:hypothetical protein